MSKPKMISNVIISRNKVKTLMDIARELREQDEAELLKTANASNKKEVVATVEEAPVVKEETVKETVKVAPVEEVVEANTEEEAVEANTEETVEEEAVEASAKPVKFQKIAKLTDKDRSYLQKYYGKYYPADYVDALLSTY